jgi:hypothetical protein
MIYFRSLLVGVLTSAAVGILTVFVLVRPHDSILARAADHPPYFALAQKSILGLVYNVG